MQSSASCAGHHPEPSSPAAPDEAAADLASPQAPAEQAAQHAPPTTPAPQPASPQPPVQQTGQQAEPATPADQPMPTPQGALTGRLFSILQGSPRRAVGTTGRLELFKVCWLAGDAAAPPAALPNSADAPQPAVQEPVEPALPTEPAECRQEVCEGVPCAQEACSRCAARCGPFK